MKYPTTAKIDDSRQNAVIYASFLICWRASAAELAVQRPAVQLSMAAIITHAAVPAALQVDPL